MIIVSTEESSFNAARSKAFRALPVETLESPRQYGARWREAYRCRVVSGGNWPHTCYAFDNDEDYKTFMSNWS